MGKKIVLTGVTLTDTDAPKLVVVDPIESAGSILLIEPGHPAGPLVGIPSNEDVATNRFADTATDVIGGAAHGQWRISDLSDGKGLLERSGKGGIHYVTSRTLGSASMACYVMLADTFKTWAIGGGSDHHYYVSTWARKTRLEVGSASSVLHDITNTGGPSSNYMMSQREDGSQAAGGGATISGLNRVLGNQRGSLHWTGWAGTMPSDVDHTDARVFGNGRSIMFGSATAVANWIIYRAYIEDLTISERTYAEVDAIDSGLYTQHVLTPGERYYGDTWTDPATIP